MHSWGFKRVGIDWSGISFFFSKISFLIYNSFTHGKRCDVEESVLFTAKII